MTIFETTPGAGTEVICQPWATTLGCSPCDDYTLDAVLVEESLLAASELLYQLSGQQFPGECSRTIRPCTRRGLSIWQGANPRWSTVLAYRHASFLMCGCGEFDDCGCTTLSRVNLGPVTEVTGVKVDGATFPTTSYRLDDGQYLVRLDGENWPCCQDLSLPDTAPDTWSVTYTYGRIPPTSGIRAAEVLACELVRACQPEAFEGQGPCRLPRNVVQVARQGTTVLLSSIEQFVPRRGRPVYFGIPEIDMFLAAFNPYGNSAPTVVLSPDLPASGKVIS